MAVLATVGAGGSLWGFQPSSSSAGAVAAGQEQLAGQARGATKAPAPAAGSSGTVSGVRALWVVRENAKQGTSDWRLSDPGKSGDIEGFADRVSAQRGDTVALYVSMNHPGPFHVEAYRMGYYGGQGGRLIWKSAGYDGQRQASARVTYGINMVEAPWDPSLRVTVGADWPEGDYLFKLVSAAGPEHWVPLTVRNDSSTAAFVIQNGVTTWQAYNLWGGYDLYEGRTGGGSSFENRARTVSFDRPYEFGAGAADFPGNEFPFVSLAESLGLDVTYWTDVDLHEQPQLLQRHHALISLGHDEYWSTSMRRGAEMARDSGVNIAFLGANAVFRHIRFADSGIGPDRQEVDYKSAAEDPFRGRNNAEVTVDWREPPLSKHENTLIGEEYECNPVKADMVVVAASTWVFAGTGLSGGDHLHNVIGPEYDRFFPGLPGPKDVQVLAHSPVRCRDLSSWSDMTYYTAQSGAGVFATGTNWWVSKLSPPCLDGSCPHDEAVVRITENVLDLFGRGPAGLVHPSVPTPGLSWHTTQTGSRSSSRNEESSVTTSPTATRRRSATTATTRSGTSATTSGSSPATGPTPTGAASPPPTASGGVAIP